MIYKVGDKVRFLNDVGGGVISRIASANLVMVTDEDGFEIPVSASEIVVVGQDSYKGSSSKTATASKPAKPVETKSVEPKPVASNIEGDSYELLFAFLPKNQANIADSDLDLYFINDSSFYCMYSVAYQDKSGKFRLLDNCEIEPETKKLVTVINREKINSGLSLNLTCFLYKHIDYKLYPPEQLNVVLNPLKFFKNSTFVENDFFDEDAYLIKVASSEVVDSKIIIDPKELEKAIKEKKDSKPVLPALKQNIELEEIDLHIEQLVDDTRGMDNGEMLEIQLARFTTALDLGISAKTRRMVFIHGVGNGKLKHEIRRLLETQYAGKVRYQDASFKEYGYGATMVIIS